MSHQWFEGSKSQLVSRWWLSIALSCLMLVGCQSVATREISRSAIRHGDVSISPVSNPSNFATPKSKPARWQLLTTQLEAAERQAAVASKPKGFVMQVSLESELWQGGEPPPLVTCQTGPCNECPSPESESDCEYPGLCWGCDISRSRSTAWCDAKGVLAGDNWKILAGAGGVALWFREGDIDREVREKVAANPLRWGDGSQFLGKVGDIRYQAPVLLSLYGYSIWSQDEELHDVMSSLLSASVITGVSTTALKLITNTDRPSDQWMNGEYGFPSYHTASTFAIAAVLDEYYGCKVGLPAYMLAGAVGFSRLDEQDHDLSDVVFGGTLGFVIGKAVAGRHLCGNSKIKFAPYFHPADGSPGIGGELKF